MFTTRFNLASLDCREMARVAVPGGRVHVLIANSSSPLSEDRRRLLTEEERTRHDSLVIPSVADHYTRSHLSMRLLVAAFLGVNPEDIHVNAEPCLACGARHGRPCVAHHDVALSLSHSAPWIMVGVSRHDIGVDIEVFPTLETARSVISQFHPVERAFLQNENPLSVADFTRMWCHKEAYLKGLGVGLTRDMSADDLTQNPDGWQIVDIGLPEAGVAAAAAFCLTPLTQGGCQSATEGAKQMC